MPRPTTPTKKKAYRVLRGINYDTLGRVYTDKGYQNKRAEAGDIIHDFPEHLAQMEIDAGVLELVEEN